MPVHLFHSVLGSLRTHYILPHKTLNIRAPLYKLIWIDFNGKKLPIYERCWSAWLEATETGARRLVLLFYSILSFFICHFDMNTELGSMGRGEERNWEDTWSSEQDSSNSGRTSFAFKSHRSFSDKKKFIDDYQWALAMLDSWAF